MKTFYDIRLVCDNCEHIKGSDSLTRMTIPDAHICHQCGSTKLSKRIAKLQADKTESWFLAESIKLIQLMPRDFQGEEQGEAT